MKWGFFPSTSRQAQRHLMFFAPLTHPAAWGAGLPGSPVLAFKGTEGMTIFLVPVVMWSDGMSALAGEH